MEQIRLKGIAYDLADLGLVSGLYQKKHNSFTYSEPVEAEVKICQDWLQLFAKPRVAVNKRIGSYGLKHVIEHWAGTYVSNGAFILAAHRAGYPLIPHGPDSPNCWIGASFKREALSGEGGALGPNLA